MKSFEYKKRLAFPVVKDQNRFYIIVYPNEINVLTKHIDYDKARIPLEHVYEIGYIGDYAGKKDVFALYNLGEQTDKLIAGRGWESKVRPFIDIDKECAKENFEDKVDENGKMKNVEWDMEDDATSGPLPVDELLKICKDLGIKTYYQPEKEKALYARIDELKQIQENRNYDVSNEIENQ